MPKKPVFAPSLVSRIDRMPIAVFSDGRSCPEIPVLNIYRTPQKIYNDSL